MTVEELSTAYNTLSKRLDQIEKLLRNAVSTTQMNGVTLLLEKEVSDLTSSVNALKSRVSTLETTVNGLA
jgi:hypothetical protein